MKRSSLLVLLAGIAVAGPAAADIAVGARAGTTGLGLEVAFGLTETLNARMGYAAFNYDIEIEDTDVTYDGKLKLRNPSVVLDWHPFKGSFRLSAGLVQANTKVKGTAEPTNDEFEFGGEVFQTDEVGEAKGRIEMGKSIAPYIGLGWGNPVDQNGRVTFMFDIGALYSGTPDVNVNATCGAAIANTIRCTELQNAIAAEETDLKHEVDSMKWYPVVNLGFAVRF
jgi:hypothetical protein